MLSLGKILFFSTFFKYFLERSYTTGSPDLFAESDLTFSHSPDSSTRLNNHPDYDDFYTVLAHNPYSPVRSVILHNVNWYNPNTERDIKAFWYCAMEKTSRVKAIFVNLEQPSMRVDKGQKCFKCEYLVYLVGYRLGYEFIFARIEFSLIPKSFLLSAPALLGEAKFILFEKTFTSPLFIPCLTCDPIAYTKLEIISLGVIRETWNGLNRNMHQYLILLQSSVNATCVLNHKGYFNLESRNLCPVATVAAKYNLTLLEYEPNLDPLIATGRMFSLVLESKVNAVDEMDYIYEVRFKSTNFITVTDPGSQVSGVGAFVSPLTAEAWLCLLVTVISIAGFLTLMEWLRANQDISTIVAAMVDNLITMSSVLLGQVGGTCGRTFQTTQVAVILLTFLAIRKSDTSRKFLPGFNIFVLGSPEPTSSSGRH